MVEKNMDFENLKEGAELTAGEVEILRKMVDGEIDFYLIVYDELYRKLFDYYCFQTAEMPYGTAKARTGDPIHWILERVRGILPVVLKEGDVFELTEEMVKKLEDMHSGKYYFGVWTVGAKGKLVANRLSRCGGIMNLKWEDGKMTNCKVLDDLGILYEASVFEEIPLADCPDTYLSYSEMIYKRLICEPKLTDNEKAHRMRIFDKIENIMGQLGMVFYRP